MMAQGMDRTQMAEEKEAKAKEKKRSTPEMRGQWWGWSIRWD
jgi:hypothetical protein